MSDAVFGDPWHGLWSAATGKVTTSAAVEVDLPGLDPNDGYSDRACGDCFLIQVDGLPVPSNPPTEAAAGRTWLNYGLITGADHRLYGRNLTMFGWLYIDPDGNPWYAKISSALPGTGIFTSYQPTITFKRFGVFGGAANTSEVTPSAATGDFSLGSDTNATGPMFIHTEDIYKDGGKVILSLSRWYNTPGMGVVTRYIGGMFLLEITGTPPSASVTLTKLLSFNEVESSTYTETAVGGFSDDYQSISGSGIQSCVFGARFTTSGAIEYIKGSVDVQVFAERTSPGGNVYTHGNGNSTGRIYIEVGAAEVWSTSAASSVSWQVVGFLLSNWTASSTLGAETVSYSEIVQHNGGLIYPDAPGVGSRMLLHGLTKPGYGRLDLWIMSAFRYTNAVYGAYTLANGATLPEESRFGPVWGKIGSDAATITTAIAAIEKPIYCSEHPITGAIARSTSPVAWV